MPIPVLDERGFLPVGVFDCTIAEIKHRFGSFQGSSCRQSLFARLEQFLAEAKAARLIISVLVDGSFVTAINDPNDIDLILELDPTHDFIADLPPDSYNILSHRRVRQRFGFDLLVGRAGSIEIASWIKFFQQVRLEPGREKGILRVRL